MFIVGAGAVYCYITSIVKKMKFKIEIESSFLIINVKEYLNIIKKISCFFFKYIIIIVIIIKIDKKYTF
jgi:hypothetical protein